MAAATAGGPASAASVRNAIVMIRRTTPEPASNTGPVVVFWFDNYTAAQLGPRQWKQVDSTHWRGVYPEEGHFDDFTVVGASTDKENPGTIVRRQPDTGFEALIPPIAEGAAFNIRESPSIPWKKVSTIHIPSATSPATPSAPTSRPVESSGGTTLPAPPPGRQ